MDGEGQTTVSMPLRKAEVAQGKTILCPPFDHLSNLGPPTADLHKQKKIKTKFDSAVVKDSHRTGCAISLAKRLGETCYRPVPSEWHVPSVDLLLPLSQCGNGPSATQTTAVSMAVNII